jgi:ATP-dependent DNA helicase RecG
MQNTETNRIENKEQLNEDFEQEVIAFLNYKEGGIIYVGINKNGQVVGVENTDLTQLQIKDRIKNNIQPSTLGLFDVTVETIENKEVIKVIISSGTEKPYYLRKKGRTPEGCYIRIGSSKERMTERMIEEMFARRIKNSLKEIESPRQDLTFRQLKIHYEGNGMILNDNFARNLNLLTDEGKYNYNAYLLADENNISIKLVKYLGTSKMELIENQEYGYCCLITATQRILDRLTAENTVYAKIEYNGRKEVEMIDSKALKEAVINAMVHSDYTLTTTPIIELYSDRIEITSGGGLPQGLSQEEFLEGVTAPRNKELIRVFKDVDLIENIGSGVLRILDAYDKSCFKFMEHFLRVSFKYKENPFEYDSKNKVSTDDTINDTLNGTIKLTKNEQQILNLIINNNQITREEIVNETNLSDRTISRAIKHLQEVKIIEREGSKKTGSWKILK